MYAIPLSVFLFAGIALSAAGRTPFMEQVFMEGVAV